MFNACNSLTTKLKISLKIKLVLTRKIKLEPI